MICWMMSTSLLNLMSCPCPSIPSKIFTTLLFQAYTYSMVILLIVLYDGVMLVRMTWYTDDSVTTIHDDVVSLSVLYMLGAAINNVSSNGNHINNNNTTTPSSFLLDDAATVTVAYPWVRHGYNTTINRPLFSTLCVPVLRNWIPYSRNM